MDIELVSTAWAGPGAWSTGFAHGDFAPVNVVIRGDDLVLLDLGGLRVAPRILDLAWWGWIVRFHHPEAWADTWGVFLDAAGMPSTGELDAPAASVARLLLLERAADATSAVDRTRWLERLRTTSRW